MKSVDTDTLSIPLRSPSKVMRLERLGSMHQTRLSFMRVLLRRMAEEKWRVERTTWQVDDAGVGHALYTATGPVRTYSLLVFSNELDPAKRSDRVIAEEWDATFCLVDGIPDAADIERLRNNVPKQEAGRISARELSLSRANRSVRLFDYVRRELANGRQPLEEELQKVGYLMRTTAVYGSGKFGAIDRQFIANREEFLSPFQSELLSVYMIRQFSVDIVEHLAKADSPDTAVCLRKELRRALGIGNSTGLGMAPFVVNHPVLFNQWIAARENALQRVRSVRACDAGTEVDFKSLLGRQYLAVNKWKTDNAFQREKIAALKNDLHKLTDKVHTTHLCSRPYPWNELYEWSEDSLTLEGQECLVTLLIETYPRLVDELANEMSIDESASFKIAGQQKITDTLKLIEQHYEFALSKNFNDRDETARFWYASEEKLEPRLGERFDEPGAEREHPLAVARDVAHAYRDLQAFAKVDTRVDTKGVDSTADSNADTVAQFLLQYPMHRHVVRRVQQVAKYPYAEIRDNLIAATMLPVDLLRCKLSFFGAVKFDPRSDRWVRINMFQHAPLPDALADESLGNYNDTWIYPQTDA